jgi:pseudaminic acid cytidylyltransferase
MGHEKILIIPARGGSKRLPRKNILHFYGAPIITYPIKTALESKLFDRVIVSTDDNEIAEIASRAGATIHHRSAINSNDVATTSAVISEVIISLGFTEGLFCCLYPTSALVTQKRLREGYELAQTPDCDFVFTLCQFPRPVQRALLWENGAVEPCDPAMIERPTQSFPARYYDAGQFYWGKIDSFLRLGSFWAGNKKAIALSEMEAQDIDDKNDWALAEWKFSRLNEKVSHE